MENQFLSKVFNWMFVGLLITFGTGWLVASNSEILNFLFQGAVWILIPIVEIILAAVLSFRITKMKASTAKILYVLYTILTGLTFSTIFLAFEISSILWIFLVAALLFGIFALIGKSTKIDLSKFSTFLFMVLLGIILLEVVNLFLMNNTLNMILCIVSLIVFLGYVAYDIQKIIRISSDCDSTNIAIIGAFSLYLDFINIFLRLIQLFGRERKD